MPLSRRVAVQNRQIIRRAVGAVCEHLENRQLLTALINGKFQGTGTQFDGGSVFEYLQPDGGTVRISVDGNITAEFIGASADGAGNLTIQDLTPATATTSTVSLFEVYVVKSSINAVISIAEVPAINTTTGRPMNPFQGSVSLRINNASTGLSNVQSFPDGGVILGAETPTNLTAPANNIPIIVASQRGFGMRPASAGPMYAGLDVAPGNDLGKFFLGGTIIGLVNVPGSMTEFYAGNILTGDARGLSANINPTSDPIWPDKNFRIGGNIDNLVTANGFGTLTLTADTPGLQNIQYETGFKLDVLGRVGEVFAADSFLGESVVENKPNVIGTGTVQHEIEERGSPLNGTDSESYFDPSFFGTNIGIGFKTFDARFFNDSFDTAQFLGTMYNRDLNNNTSIVLDGTLDDFGRDPANPDGVDYYAVSMLAGQTVQVQVKDLIAIQPNQNNAPIEFGIFDPYGKLIASSYSRLNADQVVHQAIQFTASNAGAYRIAIGNFGDTNFNGALDGGEAITFDSPHPYQIVVGSVGDVALGGVIARNDISTPDAGNRGIEVDDGDLGAVETQGTIFSDSNPWYIPAGNIRSMVASSMGILQLINGAEQVILGSGPDFQVRKGSIGVLRTTNTSLTTGILMVDDDVQDDVFPSPTTDLRTIASSLAVGSSIQLVDAAGNLEGDLLSNGSIGVIRAQAVGAIAAGEEGLASPLPAPVWVANADRSGSDGIIDLIDVTGNLDSPAISVGPQGNVRYMRVGGTITRDSFFGGGFPEATTFAPGQSVTVTDDSGTPITITPEPSAASNPFGNGPANPPSISLLTYPIRYDGAGVVIVNLTVNISTTATTDSASTGVDIETGGHGSSSAEIGEIDVVSTTGAALGVPITFDPFGRTYTEATGATTQAIDVTMHGKAPISVFSINNTGAITYDNISNSTSGEIVNVGPKAGTTTLPSINFLGAAQLGIATSHTGQAVEGAAVVAGLAYPFAQSVVTSATNPSAINADVTDQQRNLIHVGDLSEAASRGAIGNILANNIDTVIAGSGGKGSGAFAGIDAPIVSGSDTGAASNLTGNIVSVQIGRGILPSGSGDTALSGVFAGGIIDSITGSGDIRGDIDAANNTVAATQTITNPDGSTTTQTSPNFAIGSIRLNGGSIIDAHIFTAPFAQLSEITRGTINFPASTGNITNPINDIGGIRLDGNGGIIGSIIAANDLGLTQVNGGFGVINSEFISGGSGVSQGIVTDGYGIRQTTVEGGATLNQIIANGSGKKIPVTAFSASVRQGEKNRFDVFSGEAISGLNDLDAYLGVSAAKPTRGSITNSGTIEDSTFVGSRDLNTVKAFRILVRNPVVTDPNTLLQRTTQPGDPLYPMRISFSGTVGTIQTADAINGLSLDANSLSKLVAGSDVSNALFNVGSSIGSLTVGGGLLGTADIEVSGLDGSVGTISTRRSLSAIINIQSGNLTSLKVGGDLGSKSIYVQGSLSKLTVAGSVVTGSHVLVRHTLKSLFIGGDLQANASITARAIVNQTIDGQILGTIAIK